MPRLLLATLLALFTASAALAQAPAPAKPAQGVHYVYMVRHGMYDRDSLATDDRVANGLNALGHEQARLTGARLAGLGVRFDHLVSSEYLRAKQTADDMGAIMKLTPTRDGALNECTPTTLYPPYMANHSPAEIAECDSARQVQWARYFVPTPERDTYDVLVCHGNVIRWTLMKAATADPRNWHLLDVGNGSLTVFAIRPDGVVRVVTYSDTGHLPVAKQTWSGKGWGAATGSR